MIFTASSVNGLIMQKSCFQSDIYMNNTQRGRLSRGGPGLRLECYYLQPRYYS